MTGAIEQHVGRGLPVRRANIDTDQMFPASFKREARMGDYAAGCFGLWRRDPNFVMNRPEFQGATVLITLENCGIGSSREHAVWGLTGWGVRAVLAPSFADIFRENALKNRLLAAELPIEAIESLLDGVDAEPEREIVIDVRHREVRYVAQTWPFELPELAWHRLISGLDEIDAALGREREIAKFEATRPTWASNAQRGDQAWAKRSFRRSWRRARGGRRSISETSPSPTST